MGSFVISPAFGPWCSEGVAGGGGVAEVGGGDEKEGEEEEEEEQQSDVSARVVRQH